MFSRFLVQKPIVPGERIGLVGDELHHALRVVRVRLGETIEVFDGRGNAAEAVVVDLAKERVGVEVSRALPSREASVEIVAAVALIAPDKFELVLQKGSELGVTRFIPMTTARVETRVDRVKGKRDRWERILLEATKQCGRAVIPRLDEFAEFESVLRSERNLVVFDSEEEPAGWPERADQLTLLIGPEGGLTPEELAMAKSSSASICSLGPRRLRAETAAIAAITIAGSRFGDLTE